MGMEFAHDNGLVHGNFGLKDVIMVKDGDTNIFKITNFLPSSSLDLPLSEEAEQWAFIKGR